MLVGEPTFYPRVATHGGFIYFMDRTSGVINGNYAPKSAACSL